MFCAHVYLNGQTSEALDLYKKVFNADIKNIICDPENNDIIIHSEIIIHNQVLMLNDTGGNADSSKSGGYQLVVRFDSERELKEAYSYFEADCSIISPMQSYDYTPCQIRFIDKFDVRWAFYV